ncbi:MAG: type II toxin-antitoxin system VapC family toxin [Thermodesulfobacteriota bacterium]|nr:type II toxin-antitoxin system VapC family toxin [Thermodesulfobacteriota bacterium]
MKKLILDASVVLKWYLPDEESGPQAMDILEQYVAGDLALLAPDILPYEVFDALVVAERMCRIGDAVTQKAFHAFLELEIQLLDPFRDYDHVLSLARSFQRSVYDASYLSLAEKNRLHYVTADKRLYNAVRNKLEWVKWIGE